MVNMGGGANDTGNSGSGNILDALLKLITLDKLGVAIADKSALTAENKKLEKASVPVAEVKKETAPVVAEPQPEPIVPPVAETKPKTDLKPKTVK